MISVRDVTHGYWLDRQDIFRRRSRPGPAPDYCLAKAGCRTILDLDARVWHGFVALRRGPSVTGGECRQFNGIVGRVIIAPDDMHVGTK